MACAIAVFLLSALAPRLAGPDSPADPSSSAGPRSPAAVDPPVSPPAKKSSAPPALAQEIAALTRIRPIIERGVATGEIRSDVGVDLNNVITNLQNDLVAGQRDDPEQGVTELQTRIATRLWEGGLTQSRADELNTALSAVSPQQYVALREDPHRRPHVAAADDPVHGALAVYRINESPGRTGTARLMGLGGPEHRTDVR
jgi:serine/threonine-protein kinase